MLDALLLIRISFDLIATATPLCCFCRCVHRLRSSRRSALAVLVVARHLPPFRPFLMLFSSHPQSVDQKAVEMSVKGKKAAIAARAAEIAAAYTKTIEGGASATVSAEEAAPWTAEKAAFKAELTAESTPAERLQTAVYVATNAAARATIKAESFAEIKAALEARKVAPAAIAKIEPATLQAIEAALEKAVPSMAEAAAKGEPRVTEAEIAEVEAYRAEEAAKLAAKPEPKPAEPEAAAAVPAATEATVTGAASPSESAAVVTPAVAAEPVAAEPAAAAAATPAADVGGFHVVVLGREIRIEFAEDFVARALDVDV